MIQPINFKENKLSDLKFKIFDCYTFLYNYGFIFLLQKWII